MDLGLLPALKDKLVHAANLSEVLHYFFDHFGESPEFVALGERARHPFVEAAVAEIGRQLFGGPVEVADLLLARLPEHRFVHGGCTLNGRLGTVLFFEDVAVGLLAVTWSAVPGETKLARFTGKQVAPPRRGEPSVN